MAEKLAIAGGKPVRGEDNPLPTVFPRRIPQRAYELTKEVLDRGFSFDRFSHMVERFEEKLAQVSGSKCAIAVHNCTAALHAAIAALDCETGDEIIVSAMSDFGSAEGIVSERLVPVFADVDERTGVTTAEDIEKVITERTKGIIVVHFYGQMCDMDPIMELANRYNIPVFEDIAQAPFVKYKGRLAGTIGLGGAFSFAPEKTISIDGLGALITDDEEFAHLVRVYSQVRGVEKTIEGFGRVHSRLGINFRPDQLRCALGIAQLEAFPEKLERRIESGEALTEKLSHIEGITSCRSPNKEIGHGYWLYSFQIEKHKFRCSGDDFAEALRAEGLKDCGVARYYLLPESMAMLHRGTKEYNKLVKTIPRLAEREYNGNMTPKAKWHLDRTIRWCWTDKYTTQDVEDIARAIEKVAGYYRR